MLLRLDQIRTDGGTQPRAFIDTDTVEEYSEQLGSGVKFPKLVVFYDGSEYWLADGFHRHRAAWVAGIEEFDCDVRQGTREDAQWFSFGANQSHGLRRSNDDKQRAIKAALTHQNSVGLSNREIARHLGVDEGTVRAWRDKLSAELPQMQTRSVTRNGTTYQQNVANIGRRPEEQRPAAATQPMTERVAEAPAPKQYTPQTPERSLFAAPATRNPVPAEAAVETVEEPAIEVEALDAFRRALAMIEALPVAPAVLADFIRSQPDSTELIRQMEHSSEYITEVEKKVRVDDES